MEQIIIDVIDLKLVILYGMIFFGLVWIIDKMLGGLFK